MRTVEIELDEELLALVDEQASASGRPRSEVIAEALRRQLKQGRLQTILASVRAQSGLSEDEAMELAIAELDALRSERGRDSA